MEPIELTRRAGPAGDTPTRRQEMGMQPNDLIGAKINAALRILEWARGDIEPGISGTPEKTHIALAEAFREIYRIVDEAVQTRPEAEASAKNEAASPEEAASVPIGGEEQSA